MPQRLPTQVARFLTNQVHWPTGYVFDVSVVLTLLVEAELDVVACELLATVLVVLFVVLVLVELAVVAFEVLVAVVLSVTALSVVVALD